MKNSKQQTPTAILNEYLNTQRVIDLDRDIRKHIEKTEVIVKKEQVRQSAIKR